MENELENSFDFTITDFSDFEIDFEVEFESRYIKPPKTKEVAEHNLKYANAEKLARDIIINTNSRHFVIVNGSFIFGDFIEALIIEKNYKVKTMTISTLSLSENNVDSIAGLMEDGYVDEFNLIISDFFYSHERGNLIPYIFKELDKNNNFQLAAAQTHCKTCIFETHCGKKIVIHGSCNLRSSNNIEQFVVEENEVLYDFNFDYQAKIIEKYKTINKSVLCGKIWKAIN